MEKKLGITCGQCRKSFTTELSLPPTLITLAEPLTISALCPHCKARLQLILEFKASDGCCSACNEPSGVIYKTVGNRIGLVCPRCDHTGFAEIPRREWSSPGSARAVEQARE